MSYSCSCLNICIKGFENELEVVRDERNPATINIQSKHISFTLPSLHLLKGFSKPSLIVSQETIRKLTDFVDVKYNSLLVIETSAQWKSFTCWNCRTKTHVVFVNSGQTSIIINRGNLLDFEEQVRLKSSVTCFGILCLSSCTLSHLDLKDLPGACLTDLNSIQRVAELEIEKVRQETTLRMEIYRKEQEDHLRNSEVKINSQRTALLEQIKNAQEATKSKSEEVENLSSIQFGNGHSIHIDDAEEFTEHDMFEDSSSPQSQESDDLDDFENTPNYRSRNIEDSGFGMLAKSMPVNIGAIPGIHKSLSEDEDADGIPAPDKMAASMQALAKSVGVDSTEMFGDLPRQRGSTFRHN